MQVHLQVRLQVHTGLSFVEEPRAGLADTRLRELSRQRLRARPAPIHPGTYVGHGLHRCPFIRKESAC
jgi:hypothetical protein